MITIYTRPGHHTCRKAVNWLIDNGISFRERRVTKKNPLTQVEIISILQLCQFEDIYKIISTRSDVYKRIENDIDNVSLNGELIPLILDNPSLVTWPIVTQEDKLRLQVGFSEDRYRVFIPKSERRNGLKRLLIQSNTERVEVNG